MGAIDLGALLEQVRIGQLPEARRRGLRLEIAPAENLWVRSDSNLLRRILFNLVSNAIRYTPGGSIDVSARVSDTGEVSIRVHDTGIGIPRERLGDIFLDYVRVDETSQEGVGLGLAIVQRAVHLLGHKLTVDSVVGEGSQFELWLGTPIEREPARAPTDRAAAPPSSLEPAALFVIEDDPRSLDAMCGLAKKWGWIPYGGQSAKAVIARIAASPTNWPSNSATAGTLPGVIVSDKQLGAGESGFDAIDAVRKHFGIDDLPALMVTGDLSHAVHARAKDQSIAVVHKPCSPTLLRREIESLAFHYSLKRRQTDEQTDSVKG
jgi:anti-sigma regulatory factor (Ser/Thr protein kinase)